MYKTEEQLKTTLSLVRKEVRQNMIAETAYYRAEQREFQNGDPLGDWFTAEKEIDEKLTRVFLSYDLLGSRLVGLTVHKNRITRNDRVKKTLQVVIPIFIVTLFLVVVKKQFE